MVHILGAYVTLVIVENVGLTSQCLVGNSLIQADGVVGFRSGPLFIIPLYY